MTPAELQDLLIGVGEGRLTVADAHSRLLATLRESPYENLGFARVDHHRPIRQGFPEVILGLGKTPEQIAAIASRIGERGHGVLVTRTGEAAWELVRQHLPDAEFHPIARAITVKRPTAPGRGTIVVASAGTSDHAGRRGGGRHRRHDGKPRRAALRRRRRRHPSRAQRARALLRPPASSSSSPAWRARCRA